MDPNSVPAGVVLDEPMARALLFAATREGLLDSDPTIGDGFVRNLMSHTPSEDLIDNAFEHLVLGGKVLVPFWLPRDWKGELADRNVVVPVDPPGEQDLVGVPQMPTELILGMLASRGIRWSQDELEDRYQTFSVAYHKWEAVAEGKSFDNLEVRWALRDILKIAEEEYTPEQVAKWRNLQNEYRERMRPVLNCLEAYQRVLTTAVQNSSLSALPVVPSNESKALTIGAEASTSERRTLLRITCRALRRVPIGNTLRETLHLAASPEAQALRVKLSEWTKRLREGQIESASIVLPEVERARAHLSTAKTLSRVGEYSTWIGVPVAIGGAFVTGPIGLGVGIAVSVAGALTLSGQKAVERSNRWAMFAQS